MFDSTIIGIHARRLPVLYDLCMSRTWWTANQGATRTRFSTDVTMPRGVFFLFCFYTPLHVAIYGMLKRLPVCASISV